MVKAQGDVPRDSLGPTVPEAQDHLNHMQPLLS
jgi:hypothetical protein